MADGVAVGHFLVLVRLREQAGPRPAEHCLKVGFLYRTLSGGEAGRRAVSVIVRGRGHIERDSACGPSTLKHETPAARKVGK